MELFACRDSERFSNTGIEVLDVICDVCHEEHDDTIRLYEQKPERHPCGAFVRSEDGVIMSERNRKWVGVELNDIPAGEIRIVHFSCEIRKEKV